MASQHLISREPAAPVSALLEAEPRPVECIDEPDLGRVSRCLADMVDLESTCTVGHAAEVARLAEAAVRFLGFRTARSWNREALLHDLGKAGVSSAV